MFSELLILIILLILSACFSGIEIALFSLSNIKVRSLVEKKVKNAKIVKKLKDKPERLLITILIGNNVVNIGAASYAAVLATNLLGSKGIGIATGVMTLLVLIFGEITPKSIANVQNEKISLLVAKPLLVLIYILYPLIVILELITKFISKLSGADKNPLVSEEELKTMAKVGVEEEAIEKYEGEMISRVFELNDINVADIMTPSPEIISINYEMLVNDALPIIADSPYSRIPIYKGSSENIVGIIYVKDILKESTKCVISPEKYTNDTNLKLIDICRKPFFVPGQMLIKDLLKNFQSKHLHMAIVVDENGSLWGLVTLEDILEEIVGEIIDETDIAKELIKRLDKKNILVNAKTEVGYINHFFNITIKAPRNQLVSAYLLEQFGKIPEVGDEIIIDDIIYFISDADEKKIKKIKISKK